LPLLSKRMPKSKKKVSFSLSLFFLLFTVGCFLFFLVLLQAYFFTSNLKPSFNICIFFERSHRVSSRSAKRPCCIWLPYASLFLFSFRFGNFTSPLVWLSFRLSPTSLYLRNFNKFTKFSQLRVLWNSPCLKLPRSRLFSTFLDSPHFLNSFFLSIAVAEASQIFLVSQSLLCLV
jgi:hypothetical protein